MIEWKHWSEGQWANIPGRTLWTLAIDVSKHALTEEKAKSECTVLCEKLQELIAALPAAKATPGEFAQLQKQISSCIPAVDAVKLAKGSQDKEAVENAEALQKMMDQLLAVLLEFHDKGSGMQQFPKEIASLWLNTDDIKLELPSASLECFFKSAIAGHAC